MLWNTCSFDIRIKLKQLILFWLSVSSFVYINIAWCKFSLCIFATPFLCSKEFDYDHVSLALCNVDYSLHIIDCLQLVYILQWSMATASFMFSLFKTKLIVLVKLHVHSHKKIVKFYQHYIVFKFYEFFGNF